MSYQGRCRQDTCDKKRMHALRGATVESRGKSRFMGGLSGAHRPTKGQCYVAFQEKRVCTPFVRDGWEAVKQAPE